METDLIIIIALAIVALAMGFFISWFVMKRTMKMREGAAQDRAKAILKDAESDAEVIKKNKILEAKEKFIQMKAEHERHITEKEKTINIGENRVKQKESALAQRLEQVQRKEKEYDTLKDNLKNQLSILEGKQEELAKLHQRQVDQL